MSSTNDFIIENNRLEKYIGAGGDVVVPEGVVYISSLAFDQVSLTSLSLPATIYRAPSLFGQKLLTYISVAEDNPHFKSIDGVLYTSDITTLVLCPAGRVGELCLPQGVKTILFNSMYGCQINSLVLPATIEDVPVYSSPCLNSFTVDDKNANFKSMDGVLYDAKMETLMCYPAGREGEFYVPDCVKLIYLDGFSNVKSKKYQIHIGANVSVKVHWVELVEGNGHITIYAPIGSEAERMARRCDCVFEAEGEPVSADDSDERKLRSFKEWRQIFMFSTQSTGIHISKYVRGSKVVYLPDKIGEKEVSKISETAFPPDVTVLCNSKLFKKLGDETRESTIHSYLVNREIFIEEEQSYLLVYLKKHRIEYLEKYIQTEDYSALKACFDVMPKVKTLMEECLSITEKLGKQQVNFFLMELSRKQ